MTREERAQQKLRLVYLLWAVFTATVLLFSLEFGKPEAETSPAPIIEQTEAAVTEPEIVVQPLPEVRADEPLAEVIPEVEVAPEPEPAPEEPAEVEFDPVRDDVPLNAEVQRLLYQACGETGVPYELALAVIWKETDFRNISGDNGNSAGYMQVQQKHHSDRMERLGVTDLTDPYGNFLVGCDYLSELMAREKGLEWTLMAYNGGPSYANRMENAQKVSQYAKTVLNYMNILGGN
jgi:hypothetical protein